jgi:glycosyltransferase involved in cell wall biosynthesis
MKILQIVPSISLVYGGPSQMVLGLAPALAKQGTKVTVITTDSNGDTGQETPLDVPLNSPIEQDGYEIIYFRCSPFRRYKFSLDLLRWLNKHVREYNLAHIHALFSPVSSLAATICRQQKVPYILRPLGTLDPADLQKKKLLKKIYTTILERPNIAASAALHFTSVQEAKVSERFGVATKDLTIPLGAIPIHSDEDNERKGEGRNLLYQQFSIPTDMPLVLFMSRLDRKKGLDLLFPALEALLAEGLNFHFVLAGGNPQDANYVDKIKFQVQNSLLRSHTTITGFVTGQLKTALLQAADLFVLPSYYENFGIAVAEAMVAGTPVLISDQVHICQEVRDSESGWVSSLDVTEIAKSLRTALQNPLECQRRGRLAREYALQNYSWDAIARQTILAYNQIVSD